MQTACKLVLSIKNDLTLLSNVDPSHASQTVSPHYTSTFGFSAVSTRKRTPTILFYGEIMEPSIYLCHARFFLEGPVGEMSRLHSMRHEFRDITVRTLQQDFRSAETGYSFLLIRSHMTIGVSSRWNCGCSETSMKAEVVGPSTKNYLACEVDVVSAEKV